MTDTKIDYGYIIALAGVMLIFFIAPLGYNDVIEAQFDSNTFRAVNNSNVTFGDAGYSLLHNCTSASFYNATNFANITSQFTVSGCGATLLEVAGAGYDVNGTLVQANYTRNSWTETEVYMSGITKVILILLGVAMFGVIIQKTVKRKS